MVRLVVRVVVRLVVREVVRLKVTKLMMVVVFPGEVV